MSTGDRLYSDGLLRLVAANEPYWGGEAEVIRSYWSAPLRTTGTDRKWLIHQIYKEYWGGILSQLASFRERLPGAGIRSGRQRLLAVAEVLYEEVEHFSLFADLYRELEGADYDLSPEELKTRGAWKENDELMALRARHKSESPGLGQRAHRLTEGGHCALFAEGMALRGRGGFDDAVAAVCRKIYADEFNHMLLGIAGSDDSALSDGDWDTLLSYTVAQMKQRILMRNAQFSFPVDDARIEELLRGQGDPVKFDFDVAQTLLRQGGRGQVDLPGENHGR
jgi:hypothetical protein